MQSGYWWQRVANENLAEEQGRSLVIIPNAEHITILFRDASHQAARRWMPLWYIAHQQLCRPPDDLVRLAPASMADCAERSCSCSALSSTQGTSEKKLVRFTPAPFMASGVLILVSRVSEIQSLGGLLVGGAVGIWFFVAGVVWYSLICHVPESGRWG